MKIRTRIVAGAASLLICGSLSGCILSPSKTEVLDALELAPAENTGALTRPSDDVAIEAPDVYWMYGSNFNELVKSSSLIALGRITETEERQVVLKLKNSSSRDIDYENDTSSLELYIDTITLFEIEPDLVIKGEPGKIKVASYPAISKNMIEATTLMQYEGDYDDFAPPSGLALFFLKTLGDGLYFPVNSIQGYVLISEDQTLIPQSANSAITAGTELADIIDSIHAVLDFRDEPTTSSFKDEKIAAPHSKANN